jgi:hypothetical protein
MGHEFQLKSTCNRTYSRCFHICTHVTVLKQPVTGKEELKSHLWCYVDMHSMSYFCQLNMFEQLSLLTYRRKGCVFHTANHTLVVFLLVKRSKLWELAVRYFILLFQMIIQTIELKVHRSYVPFISPSSMTKVVPTNNETNIAHYCVNYDFHMPLSKTKPLNDRL